MRAESAVISICYMAPHEQERAIAGWQEPCYDMRAMLMPEAIAGYTEHSLTSRKACLLNRDCRCEQAISRREHQRSRHR